MADDTDTPAPATAPVLIRQPAAIRARLLELTTRVHREFLVFSPQLDARLFNTRELTEALTRFAARDIHNQVRILVEDAAQAVQDNDRVVRLCQRMSDFVHMHRVDEEHIGVRELFVVTDRAGYLHQPDVANPECVSALDDRRAAMPLARRFYEMWDRSQPLGAIRTAGL